MVMAKKPQKTKSKKRKGKRKENTTRQNLEKTFNLAGIQENAN